MAQVVEAGGGSPLTGDSDAAANGTRTTTARRRGRGPTVSGIGTGEGMVLPPRSEPWLSGMLWASPSSQRSRSCFLSPELLIFMLGLASMLSGIVFVSNLMHSGSFRLLPLFVFVAAGTYCVILIRRQRALAMAEQAILAEILEARAAEPSRRVLTKEERRALLHYFTLQPPFPASRPRPHFPDNMNSNDEGVPDPEAGERGRKHLQRGGKGESLREAHHHLNSISGSGSNSGAIGGVAVRPEAVTPGRGTGDMVEGGNGGGVRNINGGGAGDGAGAAAMVDSSSSGERIVVRDVSDSVFDVDGVPRVEEDVATRSFSVPPAVASSIVSSTATSGTSGAGAGAGAGTAGTAGAAVTSCSAAACFCRTARARACSSRELLRGEGQHARMEEEEKKKDENEEDPQQGPVGGDAWRWSTGEQCIVCFGEYAFGDDLCQLPCGHMFHAKCIDEWLDGSNHAWCPLCKMRLLGDEDGPTSSAAPQEERNEPEGGDISSAFGVDVVEVEQQQQRVGDDAV